MFDYLAYQTGASAFGRDGLDVVGLSLILVAVVLVWLLRWFIMAAIGGASAAVLAVWIVRNARAALRVEATVDSR